MLHRLGDQPVHRAALADVALDQDGFAAATLDLRGDLLRLLAATAVVNRDVSTAFAQPAAAAAPIPRLAPVTRQALPLISLKSTCVLL